MRVRRLWPAALLVLVPVLAACGDDGDEPDTDASISASPSDSASVVPPAGSTATPNSTPSPTETTPATTSTSAPSAGLPAPCDVVTAAQLTEAYGMTFVKDGTSSGAVTQQDVEWKSKGCKFEADDLAEVAVRLTGPGDFVQGKFQCVAPSDITGNVKPIDVPGATSAWWKTNEAPPLEASIRACTAEAIIEVEIEYEDGVDYEGDPEAQTADVAAKVLAAL